jgi:glutathione-specific gamma-glutamylcyclotransferase
MRTALPAVDPKLIVRDPTAMLTRLRVQWHEMTLGDHPTRRELWVFGYASLIWRPEFEAAERRSAQVFGWHRAFRMRSRVNRGSAEVPGLVFALMPGGSCHGVVYRLRPEHADEELDRLWAREMPTGVYDPRWLACRTAKGIVPGLAFTLSRRSDNHMGHIDDAQMLHILRHARGRYGRTLDYLADTAQALRAEGLNDREIERLMALARQHQLLR